MLVLYLFNAVGLFLIWINYKLKLQTLIPLNILRQPFLLHMFSKEPGKILKDRKFWVPIKSDGCHKSHGHVWHHNEHFKSFQELFETSITVQVKVWGKILRFQKYQQSPCQALSHLPCNQACETVSPVSVSI